MVCKLIESDIQPDYTLVIVCNNVRIFDARILSVDAQLASFFTKEKKRLIVDSCQWRIANVEAYKATGVLSQCNRLANRVNNGLREQFGNRTYRGSLW